VIDISERDHDSIPEAGAFQYVINFMLANIETFYQLHYFP